MLIPIYHMTIKILLLNLSHDNTKPFKYFFNNTGSFLMINTSLIREFPYDYLLGISVIREFPYDYLLDISVIREFPYDYLLGISVIRDFPYDYLLDIFVIREFPHDNINCFCQKQSTSFLTK